MYRRSLIFRLRFFIFVMMNDLYILVIGFITILVSINAILHFYIKRQHKKFFRFIAGREYVLLEKVETQIEKYSKMNTKLLYRKSNIVFLDYEIFILTCNKPTIQIQKSEEVFPGVFKRFSFNSKRKINDHLKIKGVFYEGFIKTDYIISLNLKDRNFSLEEYLTPSEKVKDLYS